MSGDIMTPADVESGIREVSNRIAKGVRICSDRYAEYLAAERDYDRARYRAYMKFIESGPAHAAKPHSILAADTEREARDRADVAYQYARDLSFALRDELKALQSLGASLRAQFAVAGRGEGA